MYNQSLPASEGPQRHVALVDSSVDTLVWVSDREASEVSKLCTNLCYVSIVKLINGSVVLTTWNGSFSCCQSAKRTPHTTTTTFVSAYTFLAAHDYSQLIVPSCAIFVNFVHFGLAQANLLLLRYLRSSLNWSFGESVLKSGGHRRLARYGFVST